MTTSDTKTQQVRQRTYLNRDFATNRNAIVNYARKYYPTKIQDLSETGVGGLLVDMAAVIGDNLNFYLDFQFSELDIDTAVENVNIERALRNSGVPISGAAPAIVPVDITFEIPAVTTGGKSEPDTTALPVLQTAVIASDSGVQFNLLKSIDFTTRNEDGTLSASVAILKTFPDGTIKSYAVTKRGLALSGNVTTETVVIGSNFVPFRRISLSQKDISEIISVQDDLGNVYYEVKDLSQDTVFVPVTNTTSDSMEVPSSLKMISAPYRYTKLVELSTRSTVLTLGGGNAETFEDDVIPDPSDIALPYQYRASFPIEPIDPNSLLATKTLGVYAVNTNLNVTYRYGGGLNHNAIANSIRSVDTFQLTFPGNPSFSVSRGVRASIKCNNPVRARGGDDAPSIDELKSVVGAYRNSQSRIVTASDMLARVYTLPSNFGRVYRAGIRSSSNSPFATKLYIISRDGDGKLAVSSDTLKKNLRTYLNPQRLIGDAVDILDVSIVNLKVEFDISTDSISNRQVVIQSVLKNLKKFFDTKNFNVDQPIIITEVSKVISITPGVISVNQIKFSELQGFINNRKYPGSSFDVAGSTKRNILYPPEGGMFEIRYPDTDIIGRAELNDTCTHCQR